MGDCMYRYIHVFLTWALVGGEWSASRPGRFTPRERASGTYWIGGLSAPQNRTERCGEEKILASAGTRTPTPRRPARSQSLYRLRYPGSTVFSK
jgi:hypothetical protein